jgi:uncharacterized damage-inducible protein DinB
MDEKDWLLDRLTSVREALLWKLEGLGEAEARRPRTPTGTNLAGLVKHCSIVEQGYFGHILGRDPRIVMSWSDPDPQPNAELFLSADERIAQVIEDYRRVAAYVDATVRELPLDTPAVVPWWGSDPVTLRALLVHVLSEVARHAGHADILREQLDATAGQRPGSDGLEVPPEGWASHVRQLDEIASAFADETDVWADE